MIDDPFSQVHKALWFMAKRNPEIDHLIKKGNQILMDKDDSLKYQISQGDLPELLLMPTGGVGNIRCSSSTTEFNKKFTWVITTGRQAITDIYYPLSWELFRAMVDWDREDTLMGCKWPETADCTYVMRATALEVDIGLERDLQERGIAGWTGLWTVEVVMRFSTASMRLKEEYTNGSDSGS